MNYGISRLRAGVRWMQPKDSILHRQGGDLCRAQSSEGLPMTSIPGGPIAEMHPVLAVLAILSALAATSILLWYLVRRPLLIPAVKVLLLLGFGAFPLLALLTSNLATYRHSSCREFCGSCHVMQPWVDQSLDPMDTSLAAVHARNNRFGAQNCYICHGEYGMLGTAVTKLGGLGHVWEYYTEFHRYPIAEAIPRIQLREPFSNDACLQCHSTRTPLWDGVPEHGGLAMEVRSGDTSCTSAGCHGPAHPFSKPMEVTSSTVTSPGEVVTPPWP